MPSSARSSSVPVAQTWSADARAYQGQLSRDIAAVTETGRTIPRSLDIEVPFRGMAENVRVSTRANGEFQGKPAYDSVGLSFQTIALGMGAPVFCSILVNIDRSCSNPETAIGKAVIAHVHAVAGCSAAKLAELPTSYTVKAGQKGVLDMATGYPNGARYHRPEDCPTVDLYSKLRPGTMVREQGGKTSLTLSSGPQIYTTQERLAHAGILAARATFVVRDDGTQAKASSSQIDNVAHRLSAFSMADMKLLEENNYKILLIDSKAKPKGGYPGGRAGRELAPDGSWDTTISGYVSYQSKVLVMPAEALDEKTRSTDVLMHELGHVMSDCRAKDSKAETIHTSAATVNSLDDDAEIDALFQAYAKRCGYDTLRGRDGTITVQASVWSSYAVQGPQEYLADGIAFYKQGETSRELLRSKDPKFFAKLQKLFPEDASR